MANQAKPMRLKLPEDVDSDPNAFELLTAWSSRGKVVLATATGTGLQKHLASWGEILAGLAENIALSTEVMTGADPQKALEAIKEGLDRKWGLARTSGQHYPR